MIIVDDKYMITGSSNLNDRSLVNDRDSEVNYYFGSEKVI